MKETLVRASGGSVIHVVPHLDSLWGGQAVAALSLARAMDSLGWEASFAAVKMRAKETENELIDPSRFRIFEAEPARFLNVGMWSPQFRPMLKKMVSDLIPDIIHLHSIWGFPAQAALAVSKESGVPLVVSARSDLYPASLGRSRLKKKLAGLMYADSLFKAANGFHATDQAEADAIRAVGIECPVLVSSDGIDVSIGDNLPTQAQAKVSLGLDPQRRYGLFLSRINYRKNPDLLVKAAIASEMFKNGWGLIIAGSSDDDSMVADMKAAIDAAGVAHLVHWTGHVTGVVKRNCFAACDVFMLPTRFENFGIVIAEALACGKPVVTSPETPWQDLPFAGAGWIVSPSLDDLTKAYREIAGVPQTQMDAMASAARKAVAKLTWEKAAVDMAGFYKSLRQQ